MNAEAEVKKLLRDDQAKLVRAGKHLVYRLSNGETYTQAKTPSDHRSWKNQLTTLRGLLGVKPQPKQPPLLVKPEQATEQEKPMAAAMIAPTPAPLPEPEQTSPALRERIENAINIGAAKQEQLLAEAGKIERTVNMLKAIAPFAETDEDLVEATLAGIMPLPPPPPSKPVVVMPEPPQAITDRVQVTRQLVYAATQTFDDTFTINDVLDRMVNGRKIDPPERQRIRSSIISAMNAILERGETKKEVQGIGRQQTIWRAVKP